LYRLDCDSNHNLQRGDRNGTIRGDRLAFQQQRARGNLIKRWQDNDIDALELLAEQKLALKSNLALMHCVDEQITLLEETILAKGKLKPEYQSLRTVSGIGEVLALTIALETGELTRFAGPGNFASHARTVNSRRESNGKKKGEGNTKCGNKFLAWAFVEAAHFAVRYDPAIARFYQKKCAKSLSVVAIKAVATAEFYSPLLTGDANGRPRSLRSQRPLRQMSSCVMNRAGLICSASWRH